MEEPDSNNTVNFSTYKCSIQLAKYANQRLAIKLVNAVQNLDSFIGEPIATATINVPELEIKDSQIIVKSYRENTGMLEALENAGLITNAVRHDLGHIEVYVADKTERLIEMEAEAFKPKKLKMH